MVRYKGFTLLELLVTVAILGIIAAMAIPSFARMIQNNRIATVGSDFHGALSLARTEAVKRSSLVVICPTVDGESCAEDTEWSSGWMVFITDENTANSSDLEVKNIIRRWDIPNNAMNISVVKNEDQAVDLMRFNSRGLLIKESQSDSGTRAISISAASCQAGAEKRTITVGFAGLIDAQRSTCS